jgi:D-glycero-D-manno-heptose 1,7-bisphosphate phosphatase
MSRPAVFLDRDGTIVPDTGFLRDAGTVTLLPGAGPAIGRVRAAGFAVIVVTNQSGIARQLVSWDEYQAVARAIDRLLADHGATIDATYVCPHHPELTGPCQCRKPGTKHYLDAARAHALDLSRSVWIGDRITDLLPARVLGGRGILVETGQGSAEAQSALREGFEVAADLGGAVGLLDLPVGPQPNEKR